MGPAEWGGIMEVYVLSEFQPEIVQSQDRTFRIFIANQTAEKDADVIRWSGGNGVPVYKDYAVAMFAKERDKKVNLYIAIGAEPRRWMTSYQDAIMNGIEIFKVSDPSNGNLAGPNPDPILVTPPMIEPPKQSKNSRRTTIFVAVGGVTGLIVASILGFLIFRTAKKEKDSFSTDWTTWWGPFSLSTTKSTKTCRSPLSVALSRRIYCAVESQIQDNQDGEESQGLQPY